VPRRVAPRPYGKARPKRPSRRGTVFILRPAGPKVKARRAEAKFWVWLIGGATIAEKAIEQSAEARSAEAKGKFEARRAEPTWHCLRAEA